MATVLFVAPHQDDETLSMGAAIRKHLEVVSNGVPTHDVHVLLLTAGSGSFAQGVVGLSDGDFSAARDDEYRRACRALGVRWENIHFASSRTVGDTVLTVAEAEAAIGAFAAEYPGVWVKTYSNRPAAGRHVDHVAAGQAAVNLLNQGVLGTNTLRLYVEPWALSAFQQAHPSVSLMSDTASATVRVHRALDEYQDVDHIGRKYGIGDISVGAFFDQVRANPVSRYHIP